MEKKKQESFTNDEVAESSIKSPGAAFDHEQELAATKIQSRVRGKHARRGTFSQAGFVNVTC